MGNPVRSSSKRSRQPSSVTIAEEAELVGVACELSPVQTGTLPLQYTVGLHAWFLDCCGSTNPELSQYLHDGQSEKLSTLSQFEGQDY
ncbi:hypothetical protein QM565_25830 [Geitlerinema splendidum]|nr:hypothetical protein [Geitlerinema splendidum]